MEEVIIEASNSSLNIYQDIFGDNNKIRIRTSYGAERTQKNPKKINIKTNSEMFIPLLPYKLKIQSKSGLVMLKNIILEQLELESDSGNTIIENAIIKNLSITSVHGNVSLANTMISDATIMNTNGNIDIMNSIIRSQELSNVNGQINLSGLGSVVSYINNVNGKIEGKNVGIKELDTKSLNSYFNFRNLTCDLCYAESKNSSLLSFHDSKDMYEVIHEQKPDILSVTSSDEIKQLVLLRNGKITIKSKK